MGILFDTVLVSASLVSDVLLKKASRQEIGVLAFLMVCKGFFLFDNKLTTRNFSGDPELKSIIQLLCSSILKKRLRYYTFGQLERLEQVHAKLVELKATVGSVVSLILNHDPSASLFEEILNLN